MRACRGSILLVDDEPVALRGHAQLLARLGFRVAATDHGYEALGMVAAGGIEVVLADAHTSDRSGPELARELCAVDPAVQLIYLSGQPSIEIVSRSAAEGAAFLKKPVAMAALTVALDEAVARGRRYQIEHGPQSLAGRFEQSMRGLGFHYQPIVRASSGRVVGWEALMRPSSGLRGPLAVIEAARRLDRFEDLGRVVRRRASEPWGDDDRRGRANREARRADDPGRRPVSTSSAGRRRGRPPVSRPLDRGGGRGHRDGRRAALRDRSRLRFLAGLRDWAAGRTPSSTDYDALGK